MPDPHRIASVESDVYITPDALTLKKKPKKQYLVQKNLDILKLFRLAVIS